MAARVCIQRRLPPIGTCCAGSYRQPTGNEVYDSGRGRYIKETYCFESKVRLPAGMSTLVESRQHWSPAGLQVTGGAAVTPPRLPRVPLQAGWLRCAVK
jgi:hypothetical protein